MTELSKSVVPVEIRSEAWLGRWWLGAAGVRQDDTPQHDFYSCLKREVRNGSDHLLPKDWDVNRIRLELAYRSTKQLHDVVYRAIAASVRAGRPVRYEARNHYVQAQVDARTPDEIYLLIGACGVYDPKIVAVLLSAVPDVKADDWIPEPDSAHYGAKIEQGEVVYSTVITSDTLKAIIAKAIDLDD
ncbi:hypothetical protein [Gordonia malaquae]|uniref:hypothetical protein n=1 Tax=Gordonia malaquae TaxID=410332 RepID=UPI003017854F